MNKNFFYILAKTFSSPVYYLEILKAPFSFSLKYFFLYFFFYSIIGTAVFASKSISPTKNLLNTLPSKITQIYPSELEITISGGKAKTNVTEPYIIPLGDIEKVFSKDKVLGDNANKVKNLLVIDTKGSIENFYSYQTAALLTEKNIAVADDKGGYKIYPLENAGNITINRGLVDKIIFRINPFLKYVIPTIIFAVFLYIFIFIPSYYMIYLLFFAFLFWLLAKILKSKISFSKSYQMGIHLVTITATIFGLASIAQLKTSFPFLQTIILLAIGAIVLSTIKKSAVIQEVPPPVTLVV